jgi:hypothetical protein
MAPRKQPRYKTIAVPMGMVIIDRKERTWTVTDGAIVLDYGSLSKPAFTHYLDNRR